MAALDEVRLVPLMELTQGREEIAVGLIDGPVAIGHPALADQRFREVSGSGSCRRNDSGACVHGTLVAGVLAAKRGSPAPGICPGCTFLLRPIFGEESSAQDTTIATPEELAGAIADMVDAGAHILNLSVGLLNPSPKGVAELYRALDYAALRGVICVVAAGNQRNVGGSALTRHPWVIPVAACGSDGRPTELSNLGSAIGRRGVAAPGVNVISLGADGGSRMFGGTSAAAPFVTGTIALLWSLFPQATARELQAAIAQSAGIARRTVVPPLLNAWAAYGLIAGEDRKRAAS